MRIASYAHTVFSQHAEPEGHPERRQRFEAALRGVQSSRVAAEITHRDTRQASQSEILRVHSQAHLLRLAKLAGHAGNLDPDTYYSAHSYSAALHAAGAACLMVEQLLGGDVDYGFVPARPPGHHAEADTPMGFCLLNNAAIAAAHARASGVERVTILDWDVHHGNGTEAIFYADSRVQYLSVHESPQYPGTGAVTDVGEREGVGYNINVPLSPGATDAVYLAAFERVVLPSVESFAPGLVLVSAGFDSHERDPLGGMRVTQDGFGTMMKLLLERLPKRGQGRVGLLLEGGYNLSALEQSVAATLSACDPRAEFACANVAPVEEPWATEIERARRVQKRLSSLE